MSSPASDRQGVLVTGLVAGAVPRDEVRLLVHRANLAVARETPGEQPYVVGWDLLSTEEGPVAVLDVNDDPGLLERWVSLVGGRLVPARGALCPEDASVRVVQLELDESSMSAQRQRDGLLDRFHATVPAALGFADRARAWVGEEAVFYRLDSAGVRTYWPSSPLEQPLTQTLDDVAIGYGGPVGYAVTAIDDRGWRRVGVEALGKVRYMSWSAGRG